MQTKMDLAERIASIIFDFDGEYFVRPSEEDAMAIAKRILEIDSFETGGD